jgi:hypothetical protein
LADKPRAKLPLAELDRIGQLIDEARSPGDVALSKQRAVARLAPKIRALHERGYSWRDVAAWLTEHGLPVTAPALQASLRRARGRPPEDDSVREEDGISAAGHAARGVPGPASGDV